MGETEHRYGARVHLLGDPWLHAVLARIGSPEVKPPLLGELVRGFYRVLLARVAAAELPAEEREVETRMRAHTPAGVWRGIASVAGAGVVVANVLRGGNQGSLACFDDLCAVLGPERVRLDYLYLARKVDACGRVAGVDSAGSKIGGSVDGATLLVPDPMGATGSTILEALAAYERCGAGAPRRVVAMHLIVTPEYLRQVLQDPRIHVWAGRVDRGTSAPDVQRSVPGARFEEEFGLDEHDYIVPGAGGLGEVLNNSFV